MQYQTVQPNRSDITASTASPSKITGCHVGWLVGVGKDGYPLVDFHGNEAGPIVAQYTVSPGNGGWSKVLAGGSRIVLVFERGDRFHPIIIGVMRSSLDEITDERSLGQSATETLDVRLDNRHVILDAKDEIVLRCGKGSITIKRDGEIIIKGTHIVSRSTGANKIKGSAVKIN